MKAINQKIYNNAPYYDSKRSKISNPETWTKYDIWITRDIYLVARPFDNDMEDKEFPRIYGDIEI